MLQSNEVNGVAMTEDWQNSASGLLPNEIAFDYLKASDFKVVWADGGIGGVTPNGLVHLSFYAERHAIPRRQIFSIIPIEGTAMSTLGNEVVEKQLSRRSIVREMACDVMMSPETAENLARWLLEQSAIAKASRVQG